MVLLSNGGAARSGFAARNYSRGASNGEAESTKS